VTPDKAHGPGYAAGTSPGRLWLGDSQIALSHVAWGMNVQAPRSAEEAVRVLLQCWSPAHPHVGSLLSSSGEDKCTDPFSEGVVAAVQ